MDKAILRNKLFDKYFEVENGILLLDLVSKLSFIPELWKRLHVLCESYIDYFDSFSTLEKFRLIEHKQNKYLFLKWCMIEYVVIDIQKMENITERFFKMEFDEAFFVNNFGDAKTKCQDLFDLYNICNYNGNVRELVSFYIENQAVFKIPTELYYRLEMNDAWTYLYVDFANADVQMGFQTLDQFLYEQLFLKYDLSANRMQDAHEKIGMGRMQEMFEKIKELTIPREVIPDELYQQFLNKSKEEYHKLQRMRIN